MRKRINLPVDKLINKSQNCGKSAQTANQNKPLTFQELYRIARKHSQNSNIHPPYHSANVSQHSQYFLQSLKSSAYTPQNSNRNPKRLRNISDKLNRSLQSKSNLQNANELVRSFSNQKKVGINREKSHKSALSTNEPSKNQSRKATEQQESSSLRSDSPKNSQETQFFKEFKDIVGQLDHSGHSHLRETECFLNIQEIFQIMKQLHYLRKIEDEKYLVRIWQELQGETYGGIPSQNIYEFLTFINHYNPCDFYPASHLPVTPSPKKIIINSNLKIVATEQSKLQIYEQYLALRVNRILYGSTEAECPPVSLESKGKGNNIKIVDADSGQLNQRVEQQGRKLGFQKKNTTCKEVVPPKRAVRLKSASSKRGKEEETSNKQSEETICHSELSESKELTKNLNSHSSETTLTHTESNEQSLEKKPILSIDVNLGDGVSEKLLVFQGESALEVSQRLVSKYNIDQALRLKFQTMLKGHIRNLLWRIEQVSEQLISDREE